MRCGALVWPAYGIRCEDSAAGKYQVMCVHEHLFECYLCEWHAGHPGRGECRICAQLPGAGHRCSIGIRLLVGADA